MSSGRTARLTGVAVPVDPLEGGVSRGCRRASWSRRTGSRCGSRGPKTTVPFDGSSDHVGNRPLAGGAGAVPAPLAPLRGSRRVVRRVIKARPPHLRTGRDLRAHRRATPVTAEQMESLSLKRDKFHGDWNYRLTPRETLEPLAKLSGVRAQFSIPR